MANSRNYSNIAVSTSLNGGLTNVGTSVVLNSQTGMPTPPFVLALEPDTASEELVLVASGSGTGGSPYIVTRGYDGTSAIAHSTGAIAEHRISAIDLTDSRTHEAASSSVHGLISSPAFEVMGSTIPTLATCANTVSETNLINWTIPANMPANSVFRIVVWGTAAWTGTPTLLLKARVAGGPATLTGPTVTVAPTTTSGIWRSEFDVHIVGTGGSAAISESWFYYTTFDNTAPTTIAILQRTQGIIYSAGTIDTTTTHAMQISATWGTASSSNTISAVGGYAEQVH
jgi:hypothetical protein